jgi:hypothetical protein
MSARAAMTKRRISSGSGLRNRDLRASRAAAVLPRRWVVALTALALAGAATTAVATVVNHDSWPAIEAYES